ncbi:unnamed protein product [Dicrocoelium dendriticum]|nr:unnamed protein product [Dicrocoelium dendriticum]
MPLVAPKALNGLYLFREPLAEGSFGVLYIATHAITHQKVAIKILDKRKLGADAYRVRGEIDALKQLNHKYIYKLYQVVETENYFYLVVEYLPGGELFDYILQKERLSEEEARVIFRQIVSAIGYAHSKGFAHRDLKPENILLDNDQNVRLIDFGLCAKNTFNAMLSTFCGSFAYAAPEVLANKEYCGSSADIWSLGVILYALLCGCLPFDPRKPEELPQKIGKGHFTVPDGLTKSSRQLLSQLMCVDPKKRIKMEELRRHPWIVEGFMGHPVDLNEEKIPMTPLNMRIVSELSEFTRIPKVEMVRLLQRRSYDYLMATYMIMETALEEENVFIHLQPARKTDKLGSRSHSRRPFAPLSASTSVPLTLSQHNHAGQGSASESSSSVGVSIAKHSVSGQQLVIRNGVNLPDDQLSSQDENIPPVSQNSTGRLEGSNSSSLNKHPVQSFPEDQPAALSPSRSVDSQLAHLTNNLQQTRLSDLLFPVRSKGPNPNSGSSMPASLSRNYLSGLSSASSASSNIPMQSLSLTSSSSRSQQCPNDEVPSSGSNGPAWRQFGRLRDVLTPKKPTPVPDGRLVSDKLRKTRHLNNVFLVREGLSPGQAFDQIAAALHQQSIRFTLKGSGFLCVFANDWGRTVLSFELELVYVSARAVEAANAVLVKRRVTLKPRPTIQNSTPARPAAKSVDKDSAPPSVDSTARNRLKLSTGTPLTNVADCTPRSSCARQLGIKMKRLHGDSFMYTSLCRTILDLADVRIKQ